MFVVDDDRRDVDPASGFDPELRGLLKQLDGDEGDLVSRSLAFEAENASVFSPDAFDSPTDDPAWFSTLFGPAPDEPDVAPASPSDRRDSKTPVGGDVRKRLPAGTRRGIRNRTPARPKAAKRRGTRRSQPVPGFPSLPSEGDTDAFLWRLLGEARRRFRGGSTGGALAHHVCLFVSLLHRLRARPETEAWLSLALERHGFDASLGPGAPTRADVSTRTTRTDLVVHASVAGALRKAGAPFRLVQSVVASARCGWLRGAVRWLIASPERTARERLFCPETLSRVEDDES